MKIMKMTPKCHSNLINHENIPNGSNKNVYNSENIPKLQLKSIN